MSSLALVSPPISRVGPGSRLDAAHMNLVVDKLNALGSEKERIERLERIVQVLLEHATPEAKLAVAVLT